MRVVEIEEEMRGEGFSRTLIIRVDMIGVTTRTSSTKEKTIRVVVVVVAETTTKIEMTETIGDPMKIRGRIKDTIRVQANLLLILPTNIMRRIFH
jgi:hypothetical protein